MSASASPPRAIDRGLRYLAHERIEPAIEAFSDAIADEPSDPAAHAFLAAALFAAGQASAADDAIKRALALQPDGFWPNLKGGELRFRLGDNEAAATHLLVALRVVEPGTREHAAAADALARTRRATSKSIAHRARLPIRFGRRVRPASPASNVAAGEPSGGGP